MHQNFLSSWNTYRPNGNDVCVHGFLDDTGFYQTLPWTMKGWHAGGTGANNANNTLIGFEICEPKDYADKEYFETVKNLAIELCVYLCKEFNFDSEAITTHCEGYERYGASYACNHADIHHWWKKYHNYSIADFRKDVQRRLDGDDEVKFKDGKTALDYLAEKGRISEKEYWDKVLVTTNKVEYLFMKWAEDYSKLVGE